MTQQGPTWPCLSPARPPQTGCLLQLAVSPNAKRTATDGLHDGCLRVRLHAPPVDGKANEALLAWLSGELQLPRRAVTLLRGETSRRKTLHVEIPIASLSTWLADTLGAPAGER